MNKLKADYKAIIKSRKKVIWFSIICTLLLLMVCYLADNLKYSVLSGPSVGQRIEQFREITGLSNDGVPEEYVFINVAYDKELVPIADEYGLPMGEMDITDRCKLASFLSQLQDAHRYVMMDVLLSGDYISDSDSLLIDAIIKADRISISRSSTSNLLDERLNEKAGYIDYSTDISETNFVKFQFLQNGSPTMPYMAYESIYGPDSVKAFGPFYWRNGHLNWNTLTLRFPIKLWNTSTGNTDNGDAINLQEKKILNLGADILDLELDIPSLVKDRVVVIGDFTEEDIHDTYLGKIAGPVINVNALEALKNNELEIPWSLIEFLFVFYVIVTYLTVRRPVSTHKILSLLHINKPIVRYLLSFIGYSFLFSVVGGAIYLICGRDINIIIPSVWFTFLRGYTNTFAS